MSSARASFKVSCLLWNGQNSIDTQHTKEARGNTTRWTAKLASYSKGNRNSSRDFYRNNPLPVDPWIKIKKDIIFCLRFYLRLSYCLQLSAAKIYNNYCSRSPLAKEPTLVSVKVKNQDESTAQLSLPVLLPQDLLEYLVVECKLRVKPSLVTNYWKLLEVAGNEVAVRSQELRQQCSRPIWPLGLHGDEACMGIQSAPYDKIVGVFLNIVVFRPTATRLSRYLLFSIDSSRILTVEDSIFPLLEAVTNSLNHVCEVGVDNGRQRFLLTELRGDQVWFRQIFRHRSWWLAREVCHRCCASINEAAVNCYTKYKDFTNVFPPRTTEEFVLEELPLELPLCFSVSFFFGRA